MSHSVTDSTLLQESKTTKNSMKVVLSRSNLVQLIGAVQSIVPSKPALPILSNILVEARDGQLFISATDLTVSIRAFIEADVQQEGAITLPARKFFQLVRELTSSNLEIECVSGEVANITAGSSRFRINGIHKSEYPTLPDLSDSPTFQVPASKLQALLSKTSFAAAREDSRQVLNGIKMQVEESGLTLYGTDGKRLAKVAGELENGSTTGANAIVPLKAVEEIIRMLNSDDDVKVAFTEDRITVDAGSIALTTKLLFGQYPDVERVIPYAPSTKVLLHKEELTTLLKQISLFTSETSHSVRFRFANGELELSATSRELGEGRVSMPVDFHGEKIDIAFNPYFFLDILRHCEDEIVSFGITDSFNPGVIHDGARALFVIMPMRLNPS